jgi:predicted RNA-binding Zn ribbon-like protein
MARTLAGLERVGNALCLDFANTVNSRAAPTHDYLASYSDLLDWSEHAGALPAAVTGPLRSRTGTAAGRVLAEARRLRDTVYAVFSPIAADRRPAPGEVDRLGTAYAAAMANVGIASVGIADGGYAVTWPVGDGRRLDAPLWPVARSAGELLLSGPLDRIGECPGCGWLFLDVSRNGARRWCSMATCGSRDKMARYRR